MLSPAQQAAIPIMAAAAVASEIATRENGNPGLPAELTMAQCIFECSWLQKAPGNNAFGIKSYPGCFGIQILPTTEWMTTDESVKYRASDSRRSATLRIPMETNSSGRALYNCMDAFATFQDLAACFAYHGRLITKSPRYAKAWAKYCVDGSVPDLIAGIAPIYAPGNAGYAVLIGNMAKSGTVTAAIQNARVQAAS